LALLQDKEFDMTPEQRAFLESRRLVIVGIPRTGGPPHMSPVYYVLDGDDILISTTASRFKARAVRKHQDVSLCVLAEEFPFPYLLVYGTGVIEDAGAPELMMRIAEKMSGNPLPDAAKPAIADRAAKEGRVVLRVTPNAFFSTQPIGKKA
jgi:PPOX class probable F420-dependent enzyme